MATIKLNPYTQAIKNCLDGLADQGPHPSLDASTAQFLANMIQGRFIQYLIARIASDLGIGKSKDKQLSLILTQLLTDKFFAVFREKVKLEPQIVFWVAQQITGVEQKFPGDLEKENELYQVVCSQHFDYVYFNCLITWLESSPEVERIVFVAQVEEKIHDPKIRRSINHILRDDKNCIIPTLLNRYLHKNRLERLISLVKSGDWRLEAGFIEAQSVHAIAWRQFMSHL